MYNPANMRVEHVWVDCLPQVLDRSQVVQYHAHNILVQVKQRHLLLLIRADEMPTRERLDLDGGDGLLRHLRLLSVLRLLCWGCLVAVKPW